MSHRIAGRRTAGISRLCTALALTAAGAAAQGPPVTPGFPNVARTAGELLSGLNAPNQGRTAILAHHNGVLFTVPELPASQPGSDFQVRTWSLADPENPVELAQWGISPMPVNAHGYLSNGEYLSIGANWPPEAPWSFRVGATPGTVVRDENPELLCAGVRGCLFAPFFVGDTWWSYGEIDGLASISRNWVELGEWDHLAETGVIGHPFLIGNLLIFASDQSRTGVATYDVSDPADPVLLDVLTTGGPGGYWPELWGGDGKLYVVFPYNSNGNGMRVVDATDPSSLQFVADVPLPGAAAMYAQFQDEYAFIGDHKIDMRTFESVLFLDGANRPRTNDGGVGVDTSQFALPLGNLLITGGIGEDQGMAVWAHQSAPDTRGPSVGFHIPRAGQTNYPLNLPITLLIHETIETFTLVNGTTFIVRPLGGGAIAGTLTFAFDDILTFTPDAPLAANTTYEVVIPAGGIKDAAANGIAAYSFTFSTGGTVGGNAPPAITAFEADPYPAEPSESVDFSASAIDPQGDPIQYRFDFGDGSPKTAWMAGPAGASHAYAEPGHYRASVQARDSAGAIGTSSRVVTVAAALPGGPRPTASTTAHCDDALRRVWVVNSDHGTISAVDADTLAVELETPVCSHPRSLARTANGELWVACSGDDTIRILSAASGAVVATIETGYGSSPFGIVASPAGTTVFATMEGEGEVRRYDVASRAQTGALALGPTPRALAMTANGSRLFVTRFLSDKDHGEVWEVAPAAMTLTRSLRLAKFGGDANRDTTAAGRGTPNQLVSAIVSPDGASLWVVGTKPNVERGLLFGPDLDSDNTVRAVAVRIDLGANAVAGAIDLDNSDSPSALAFSPLGDYLFVTLQGNNELVVLDGFELGTATGLGALVTRLSTGRAPQGVCVDGASARIFTQDFMERSTTAFEAEELFAAGTIQLPAQSIDVVAGEPLSTTVLAGKRIFYDASDARMSAEGYISCATCHLDGRDDGRVWDFTGRGEGLRRTIPLRGRSGMAHGNVHWSANFDEIQDFEGDIRLFFGGLGFMDDTDYAATAAPLGPIKAGHSSDLDALAAYVASLGDPFFLRSPHRNSDGTMTAQGATGRTVFRGLGCAGCHRGASFSDSTVGAGSLHDVGTLRTTSGGRLGGPLPGIDTPTLRGVWRSNLFLHDGSASTLEQVFTVAGGDVLPAEDGAPSNGAQIVDQYVDLNNDDTVHSRSYMAMSPQNARVTFGGVDGGAGGTGAIELRYSSTAATPVSISVNGGAPLVLNLPAVGNNPTWRHTNWRSARLEGVTFAAGGANTIQITATASFPNLSLDEIVVSRPNELALASAHREALTLSPSDRAALVSYLQQLDGTPEDNPGADLFSDGFESGGASNWSATTP